MSGYINKQIVNERGQVQVVEGTLTDGSKVYDVQFRADGVLVTLNCTGPEQADSLMIQIDQTLGTVVVVDSENLVPTQNKDRARVEKKEPRMVTKDSPDFESLRNEGRVKCSDTPGLFFVIDNQEVS